LIGSSFVTSSSFFFPFTFLLDSFTSTSSTASTATIRFFLAIFAAKHGFGILLIFIHSTTTTITVTIGSSSDTTTAFVFGSGGGRTTTGLSSCRELLDVLGSSRRSSCSCRCGSGSGSRQIRKMIQEKRTA